MPRAFAVLHRETMIAEGIAAALAEFSSLVPIGVWTDAGEGFEFCRRAHAVVIDDQMPGAVAAANRLRAAGVRVIMLGSGTSPEEGVWVSTSSSVDSLAEAVAPQEFYQVRSNTRLTHRECEVMSLVSRGFSGKQVARHLGISPKTVDNHKARIFAKLHVPNQAAAVFAFESGGTRGNGWRNRQWTHANT